MGRSPWQNKNLGKKTSIIIFLYKKNLLAGGQKYPPFFYFYCPLVDVTLSRLKKIKITGARRGEAGLPERKTGGGKLQISRPLILFDSPRAPSQWQRRHVRISIGPTGHRAERGE